MSWLAAGSTLDELVALRPGLTEDLAAFDALLWAGSDVPVPLLELVRDRIAWLLGAAGPARPGANPAEQACLALAEQVVLDPHAVTDELVEGVRAVLGDAGTAALSIAIAVFEGRTRAALVLGVKEH